MLKIGDKSKKNYNKLQLQYEKDKMLFEKELQKLTDNFGEINAQEKIEILSEYISSKGKKYHSHYATILSWARKDGWKKEQPKKRNVFLEGPEDGN